MAGKKSQPIDALCESILAYLMGCQDFSPGRWYGSFWSEKGYHGPLLDYHAGGSHHNRTAGSAALALWKVGKKRNDADLMRRAELAFDWLVAQQRPSGGYFEIQNNEVPSNWEQTNLEECSTIPMGFVGHGLGTALLEGLAPKKIYTDCLERAGHWMLSIEWPAGSGIFPHHDRSPADTLNANMHAAEVLGLCCQAVEKVTGRRLNIFYQGARRAFQHTLTLQWPDGCLPYRDYGYVTINYTSLVLWCMLNLLGILPENFREDLARGQDVKKALTKASGFLRTCVGAKGQLLWEKNETSTAKYNIWTYMITYNVLRRIGGAANEQAAAKLLKFVLSKRTKSGLLPMRDRGEEVTECAFMQADTLLFLLPFSSLV